MTTIADRKTWICTTEPAPARIRLTTPRSSRAMLDGSWWPTSGDPVVEISALVVALTAERVGPIERIMLQPAAWERHPRRIGVGDAVVRVGWFSTLDAGLVILTGPRDLRIDLAIVPPQTAFAVATATMRAASSTGNTTRAHDLLPAPRPAEPGTPTRADNTGNGHNRFGRDSEAPTAS